MDATQGALVAISKSIARVVVGGYTSWRVKNSRIDNFREDTERVNLSDQIRFWSDQSEG